MEEEPSATCRYFCHMCSLIVRPEMGIDEVKCPHCHSGFVEEMAGAGEANADADATRAPPLWAPMLIDLLGVSSRRHGLDDGGSDLAAFARRQYRNIALLQLLTALQDGDGGDTPDYRGGERVVLVSPGDARAMLAAAPDGGNGDVASGITLGDLFLGPGWTCCWITSPRPTPTGRARRRRRRRRWPRCRRYGYKKTAAARPRRARCAWTSSRPAARRGRCRASTGSTTAASCRGWRRTAPAPCAGSSCPRRSPPPPAAATSLQPRAAAAAAVARSLAMHAVAAEEAVGGGDGSRGLLAGCSPTDRAGAPPRRDGKKATKNVISLVLYSTK